MAVELNFENPGERRYLQVYQYYKDLICEGSLAAGTKLPSIRKCSLQLQISRTTVEAAYMLLAAEGYIVSRPQSGYYVTEFYSKGCRDMSKKEKKDVKEQSVRFDFASSTADRDSFQFNLWRRYVKSALRQDERLLSYGEPQGERDLREALSSYLERRRNVVCTPDRIVVGAGVQSLLHILCPMLSGRKQAYFYNAGFRQGRQIFEDHGFRTDDIQNAGLKERRGSICYLTPSQMTVWGEVMHVGRRMELLREAAKENMLLIEDDYNSEFRYYSRPTPSLQGLSGGTGVVYLGTFSRLLLPSIRMSYMVLTPELADVYRARGRYYNQTASKAEQIALCQFIRDGHLESQIRKAKKIYAAKARLLGDTIERIFGERAVSHLGEAGFLVLMEIKTDKSAAEIARLAAKSGVAVRPVEEDCGSRVPRILLSCASIGADDYEEALGTLYRAVFT